MAGLDLTKYTESYIDLPLTQFPVEEDSWNRMSDVSASLMSLVQQYNQLYANGKYTEAKKLVDQNEQLLNCFFNAEKYNQLRDAIIAVQRFMLNEVVRLVTEVAQNTIGINDNPSESEAETNTYSAKKINRLHNIRHITLLQKNWSNEYPYTQKINVQGILESDNIEVIGAYHADGNTYEQDKNIDKAASFLIYNENGVSEGAITFKAKKIPSIDFTVITKGG